MQIISRSVFLPAIVLAAAPVLCQTPPLPPWQEAAPIQLGMNRKLLEQARDYALHGGGSGYVIRKAKLVFSWGDPSARYDLKSSTKAIGVTALGLAILDGKLQLSDPVVKYLPELGVPPESNRSSGWLPRITFQHLATQTAGFDKTGGFSELLFEPGTRWSYSDGGPNWLADALTVLYHRDLEDLMFERVLTPLGITHDDLAWRANQYRPKTLDGVPRREFGSGIHANVRAMARIGFLYLHHGKIRNRQIIPESFVNMARAPVPNVEGLPVLRHDMYPKASDHYGLLWWNNADGTLAKVPRDAYWSWGLYDSLIVVIPSLDLVIARAGQHLGESRHADFSRIEPLIQPIVESTHKAVAGLRAPYPPSPMIEAATWAPIGTIVRRANGSDNWPMTWADDGHLYTAYGDGWGFEPKVPVKLSVGFARVEGPAENFQGINIRTETGERLGQGNAGPKASGMLMVDGVLFMWARNTQNSQLAWSADRGKTWTWSEWKFTTSFGHPSFLNYGRNYKGARDGYIYVYSPDAATAYLPSERIVLARVPKTRIRERDAYEFFEGLDPGGNPVWTGDVARRGAAFENAPELCYRTHVSYNAGLKRYLMVQIIPGEDTRFDGGFGIYDAPEPWGPWSTVYFTERWDTGPGESASLPTKWMSDGGKTMYLVFSGEDMFSVRKLNVRLRRSP